MVVEWFRSWSAGTEWRWVFGDREDFPFLDDGDEGGTDIDTCTVAILWNIPDARKLAVAFHEWVHTALWVPGGSELLRRTFKCSTKRLNEHEEAYAALMGPALQHSRINGRPAIKFPPLPKMPPATAPTGDAA